MSVFRSSRQLYFVKTAAFKPLSFNLFCSLLPIKRFVSNIVFFLASGVKFLTARFIVAVSLDFEKNIQLLNYTDQKHDFARCICRKIPQTNQSKKRANLRQRYFTPTIKRFIIQRLYLTSLPFCHFGECVEISYAQYFFRFVNEYLRRFLYCELPVLGRVISDFSQRTFAFSA